VAVGHRIGVRRTLLYISSGGRRVLAVCHAPPEGARSGAGVLLCGPIGVEYYARHKTLVRLGDMFARAGAHCLRFDYTGCGDSEGTYESMSLSSWLGDIAAVAAELSSRAACGSVSICGVRLGAALAAKYGAEAGPVDRLAMWDPVVNGRRHVDELSRAHERWLRGSFARASASDREVQGLGLPTSEAFREELRGIDLLGLPRAPAREVLVLGSQSCEDRRRLVEHLGNMAPTEGHLLAGGSLALAAMRRVVGWILR